MSKHRDNSHISTNSHHGLADGLRTPLLVMVEADFELETKQLSLFVLIAHLGKGGWLRIIRQGM